MNSTGTTPIFSGATDAQTSATHTVDNQKAILVEVASGAGVGGQKLFVYGSIGLPLNSTAPPDPTLPASPENPYSPLMLRDLNDMDAITGSDGLTIAANDVRLFEVNVSAVRDIHFKLTGSGAPVTVRMRGYN